MKSLCILLAIALAHGQIQLNYPLNVEFDYNLAGTLDARGINNGQRSSGALSQMTSVASIQAVQQNTDGSFLFVMNMFGTQVNVGQGVEGIETLGDDDDGLGEDMYYQQSQNGEITQVWYQSGDSPYFVEVKLGAINSFHTHTLNVNQQMSVLESTVAGVHYSNYVGSGSSSLLNVNKQFTQEDFQSFSDPNVLHPPLRFLLLELLESPRRDTSKALASTNWLRLTMLEPPLLLITTTTSWI